MSETFIKIIMISLSLSFNLLQLQNIHSWVKTYTCSVFIYVIPAQWLAMEIKNSKIEDLLCNLRVSKFCKIQLGIALS